MSRSAVAVCETDPALQDRRKGNVMNMKPETMALILGREGVMISGTPRLLRRGATGSYVWRVVTREWGPAVVKYNGDDYWIKKEVEKYPLVERAMRDLLATHFLVGKRFIVMRFIDGVDLETLLKRDESDSVVRIRRALKRVLERVTCLWTQTRTPFTNGVPSEYREVVQGEQQRRRSPLGRAGAEIRRLIPWRTLQYPLIVRETAHDFSLSQAMEWVDEILLRNPPARCVTHGDLVPGNILSDDDERAVHLIDAHKGMDWAKDLARVFRCKGPATIQRYSARPVTVEGGRLVIAFDATHPSICDEWQALCFAHGEQCAAEFNDRGWQARFWAHIAAACFNDIRFLERRIRWGVIPSRSHLMTLLLGEAVEAVAKAREVDQ